MEIDDTIALRPTFSKDVPKSMEAILKNAARIEAQVKDDYRIKISDQHIFFFITKTQRKYFSPHLHVELTENADKSTNVRGLFGPDQTVWTFFMFLHFIIAGIFLVFAMMAYSHWALKQSTTFDFIIMGISFTIMFLIFYFVIIFNKEERLMLLKK